ncbi:olfactory receptor 52B2-like [Lepisosteus oculatus]|uniref:olfactory receptor 52B2-like n=1 Tax=Lepisosteus oculatus TaxID=7918 RepID=UPI00371F884F
MDNISYNSSSMLLLERLNIPPTSVYLVFCLGMLIYGIIVFCNSIVLFTIALQKHLYQPMYLLLFNLPINDLIGATAFLPQLMKEILLDSRSISYPACVTQAFFVHLYAVGSLLILTAMAYDRYVAICCPLRYSSIMTNTHLMKIVALLWLMNFILIAVLFSLVLRLPRCRSLISNIYCDNPSLVALVCSDTSINNIYGLFLTAVLQALALGSVLYTYMQILYTCLRNKHSDARSKAVQTCTPHLVSFITLEITSFYRILSYRFEKTPSYISKVFGVLVVTFPPTLNPIIYGLKIKEIRTRIPLIFRRKVAHI